MDSYQKHLLLQLESLLEEIDAASSREPVARHVTEIARTIEDLFRKGCFDLSDCRDAMIEFQFLIPQCQDERFERDVRALANIVRDLARLAASSKHTS